MTSLAWLIVVLVGALIVIVSLQFRRPRTTSATWQMGPQPGTASGRSIERIAGAAPNEDADALLARLQRGRVSPLRGGTQQEDLRLRVREIALWCEARLSRDNTAAPLRPGSGEVPELTSNRWSVVDALARLRDTPDTSRSEAGVTGRLLVYFPDASLFDGAAAAASGGFFDDDNAPPWGTWIGYFQDTPMVGSGYSSYVLAWVPTQFLKPVQAGININPEQCIEWLEDSHVNLRQVLPLETVSGAG